MVAQNRTLCASAARRISGLLRHRAVGAVTGLLADGVAGVIGLASCGCRSGSGDRGDLRPAGAQPSLARIRLMWVSTVRSAMTSRAVVCRLVSPCTMSSAIWRSRRVSGRLRSFSGSRPRGVGLQSGGDPVAAADYAGGRQRWAEFGFGLAGKLVQSGRPGRWRSRRRQLPAALEGDNRSHPRHSQPRPGACRLKQYRPGLINGFLAQTGSAAREVLRQAACVKLFGTPARRRPGSGAGWRWRARRAGGRIPTRRPR
jgi:hypothetical protein